MTINLRRGVRRCAPVLALAWGSAWAQSAGPVTQLAPVVITATRSPVPLREVLSDVTVLTRDDLERTVGNLGDVLRSVPGLQTVRSGGPAGTTTLFIRGGEARFSAVLVDGVRVDTQTTGGATWESLPLSQIERVEIVRGPASAVYGSDAMSGVVQIFTRKGEGPLRVDAGVGLADHHTRSGDASVTGQWGALDFALSGEFSRSRGFDSTLDGHPDRDGYLRRGAQARVGWAPADGHRLEASALRTHLDAQYDGFMSTDDDHSVHDVEVRRLMWSAQWLPSWQSIVSAGESSDRYESWPSVYLTKNRIRTYTWQNHWREGAHTLDGTLERRVDTLDNSGLLGAQSRSLSSNALALGYGWRHDGVAVQASLRHDESDGWGSANTGSLGLGLDVAEGWRLNGSWGNGFRAPTLYQSYSEYGPQAPHAGLRPERSLSNVEVALHHRRGAFEGSLTAYRNRVGELIIFGNPGTCANPFGCYANVSNALLQGATLAGRYAADGLRVTGSIDVLSPKNLDTGLVLQRRARQHGSLSVERDFGEVTLGAQWIVTGRRFENAANTQVMGGYSVLNLDAQYRFHPEWRLQAKIDNVFDKTFETARNFRSHPLTAFIGLRWTPQP